MRNFAKLMLSVMLLQLFAVNVGAHQLHLSDAEQEDVSHSHLMISAPSDVCDMHDDLNHLLHSVNGDIKMSQTVQAGHQHNSLNDESVELCLDCQCHGGHSATIEVISHLALNHCISAVPHTFQQAYFPPDARLSYRPPIA